MTLRKAIEQIKCACELGISSGEKIEPKYMLLSLNYILENFVPLDEPVKPRRTRRLRRRVKQKENRTARPEAGLANL